jgi:hypothetical protein
MQNAAVTSKMTHGASDSEHRSTQLLSLLHEIRGDRLCTRTA